MSASVMASHADTGEPLRGQQGPVLRRFSILLRRDGHEAEGRKRIVALLAKALREAVSDERNDDLSPADIEAHGRADGEACLRFLMQREIEAYPRGHRQSVRRWIKVAAGPGDRAQIALAQRTLKSFGIKILRSEAISKYCPTQPRRLGFAHQNAGLTALFEGSRWIGEPGEMGGWVESLRFLPDAGRPRRTEHFDDRTSRVVTIPLTAVIPLQQSK